MKISIVVPVFNSSDILDELVIRIKNTLEKIDYKDNFELILINDFSGDSSWIKIKNLRKKYFFIKGINLSENFGQHNAIMAGLNNLSGDYVITLDDDLQHPPEYIPNIIEKLNDFDVCYTNYKNRKHIGWKKAVSTINNIVSSFLLNKPLRIYMSSFRGLKKNIVLEIIKFKKPDVYIDGLIINLAKNIEMITVEHHARKKGESNYTLKKLLILWSNMLINFSFFPFKTPSIFGIVLKFLVKLVRKKNIKPQYKISEIISNENADK